jgi:ABC transport system ATP-binding/permease protein
VRELGVGVRLDAYLLAKASLLFLLAAVQCVLLIAVATAIQPLHAHIAAYVGLTAILILTSWTTVAIGLVISTLARSVDQATSFIPLLLIPLLLFGGALVPFAKMSAPIKALADLMVSRWSFAGAGHAIDMSGRLAAAPGVASISGYSQNFFALGEGAAAIILLGFAAALLLVAAILLARRGSRSL